MNVEIKDSVRQAGLEEAIRKVSELFRKAIPRSLQPLADVTWEVLRDPSGVPWVLVALEYDGLVTEHAVFEATALNDAEFMQERLEWLWGRVLRTRLLQRLGEPIDEVEELTAFPAKG
jgi:hypothetical protein